jgi:hypothetical protein
MIEIVPRKTEIKDKYTVHILFSEEYLIIPEMVHSYIDKIYR